MYFGIVSAVCVSVGLASQSPSCSVGQTDSEMVIKKYPTKYNINSVHSSMSIRLLRPAEFQSEYKNGNLSSSEHALVVGA